MTLLLMEGFDLTDFDLRYPTASTTSGATRFGTGASLRVVNYSVPIAFTASSEVFIGFAFLKGSATAQLNFRIGADGGSVNHMTVSIGTLGSVTLRLGSESGTVLASVPDGSVTIGSWNYMEIRAIISDTVGVLDVRLNGSTSSLVSFSGDTKNGGTSTNIDELEIHASGGTQAWSVDDLYILNTSGSTNNTWLGDVRVVTVRPNGNGSSSQFVGSDGNSTDNYLLVDETAYSTADYTGSGTVGQKDLYAMSDLPAGTTSVFAVQEIFIGLKSDAGYGALKPVIRTNSTNYTGSAYPLSTSPLAFQPAIRETNPNTGVAWTPAEIDALEAGAEVA